MAETTTAFADRFDLMECHFERCEKPTGPLAPTKVRNVMTVPPIGRVTMDVYSVGPKLFTRFVRMEDGEVAWFTTTVTPAEPPHA